jgi:RimJ/RimL family protein N-acetyltransferase
VPLGHEHLDLTIQLDMDPKVMKHVAFGVPFTKEQALQVHQWLLDQGTHVPGFGTWVGFAGGEFVGWWILSPTPAAENSDKFDTNKADFGFRLSPKVWGQGYAKEGGREVIRHAFQDLGLMEVSGDTMTVNVGSRATMESCGLKHTETFFNTYPTPPPGIEEGEMRYTITREDWISFGTGAR